MSYYLDDLVQKEITEFCKGRWLALHCLNRKGKLVFRRYLEDKPIAVNDVHELNQLLKSMGEKGLKVRTVYATINIYKSIKSRNELYDLSNIVKCTPTWDIDSSLKNWRRTVKVVRLLLNILNDAGVKESVFIKWSGNGCHVHINESAISEKATRQYHPIDVAYAIVEYARRKLVSKIGGYVLTGIKVENKIDVARVFTAPLSLHRRLDVACICIMPEDLDEFTPEWLKPSAFRHSTDWRRYSSGEADDLAVKAIRTVGRYPGVTTKKRKTSPLDRQIMKWLTKK
ncbi:MAG TPA: hypothetical protein ENF42_02470 [Candidatus Bathyarchaeota archaeon]|nr:hypothetical protein [Candidatus Bathyarchaeota archaeon]